MTAGGVTYSSEDGSIAPNGYQNIFTGTLYAQKGPDDAVDGGKGGQDVARVGEGYDAESVTYGGQTWIGGQHGAWNYEGNAHAGGGGGSGAVVGHNGNNGTDASPGGYAGHGADGLTPAKRPDTTVIGQGGLGSHGSSGGGGGGATDQPSGWSDRHYGEGGEGGVGQHGSKGGPGGVIAYF